MTCHKISSIYRHSINRRTLLKYLASTGAALSVGLKSPAIAQVRAIKLGYVSPLTGPLAAAIAGEDPALVLPLMGSLRGDLLPAGDDPAALLGVPLHSFDSAVENALREWEEREPLAAR